MGTVFIGIAAIAAFIIPVFLIHKSGAKRGMNKIQALIDAAKERNVAIAEYDFCNESYFIGVDSSSGMLFYSKHAEGIEHNLVVPIAAFDRFRVEKKIRNVGSSTIIDSIFLAASPIKKGEAEVHLEFYNSHSSNSLFDGSEVSEKWAKKLNSVITPR